MKHVMINDLSYFWQYKFSIVENKIVDNMDCIVVNIFIIYKFLKTFMLKKFYWIFVFDNIFQRINRLRRPDTYYMLLI